MRALLILAIAAVGLSIAWNKRADLQRLWAPPPPPPKAIEFDNGTVRQYLPPASAAPSAGQSSFQPGAMRKCLRGGEVQYTNITCPPGFKEAAVAGPPVTVLESGAARAASGGAAGGASTPATGGRARLQNALGLTPDEGLKERIMQRAIEQQR